MRLEHSANVNRWPVVTAGVDAGDITIKQEDAEHRFVTDELGHRIKNLVAVIQSIARQTMQQSSSKKDFEARFSGRLDAFGHSLDLLIANNWRGADVEDLVRLELTPFGLLDQMQISAEGPPVVLSSVAARNIGLALHELATNASKYGALSVPEGKVALHWELTRCGGQQSFHMVWQESSGPLVMEPSRRGFGRQVIERATGQALAGTVVYEFLPAGVRWTRDIPAAMIVSSACSDAGEPLQ